MHREHIVPVEQILSLYKCWYGVVHIVGPEIRFGIGVATGKAVAWIVIIVRRRYIAAFEDAAYIGHLVTGSNLFVQL